MAVDDGTILAPPLLRALTDGGCRVDIMMDTAHALPAIRTQQYDAVLLNWEFTQIKASAFCRSLREHACPSTILALTRGTPHAKWVVALRAGVDDVIERSGPRHVLIERMMARIAGDRIKVRERLYPTTMKLQTREGLLILSLVPTIVLLNGKPFTIAPVQQRLLAPLVAAGGGFVSTRDLIAAAWLHEGTSGRTVSSHLSDLRRKLARLGLRIEAFRGRGYALALDTSPRP
jgi:DNA-binding response OmpR family regulator